MTLAVSYAVSRYHRGVAGFLIAKDEESYRDIHAALSLRKKVTLFTDSLTSQINNGNALDFLSEAEGLLADIGDRIKNPRPRLKSWKEIQKLDDYERTYSLLMMLASGPRQSLSTNYTPQEITDVLVDTDVLNAPYPDYQNWEAQIQYNTALRQNIKLDSKESLYLIAKIMRERDHYPRVVDRPWRFSRKMGSVEQERIYRNLGAVAINLIEHSLGFPIADDLTASEDRLDQLEAYWSRYLDIPVPARQLQILGEDDRPPSAWDQAALVLVSRSPINSEGGLKPTYPETFEDNKSSILSLLDERSQEQASDPEKYGILNNLATYAAMIDPEFSVPMTHRALDAALASESSCLLTNVIWNGFSKTVTIAIRVGDKLIAKKYAKALETTGFSSSGTFPYTPPAVLTLFADLEEFKPMMRERFRKYREDAESRPQRMFYNSEVQYFASAMFLRPSLIEMLQLDDVCGTVILKEDDRQYSTLPVADEVNVSVEKKFINGGGGSSSERVKKTDLKYLGIEREVRLRDTIAHDLWKAGFGPEFQYYWPESKRNSAIRLLSELLKTKPYTPPPRYTSGHDDWWYSSEPIERTD